MQKRFLKIAIFTWFWVTNIISAGAIEAAIRLPNYRFQYLLLAGILWMVYLLFWYRRIKRERKRGEHEPVWRYYWRTRLSKGAL